MQCTHVHITWLIWCAIWQWKPGENLKLITSHQVFFTWLHLEPLIQHAALHKLHKKINYKGMLLIIDHSKEIYCIAQISDRGKNIDKFLKYSSSNSLYVRPIQFVKIYLSIFSWPHGQFFSIFPVKILCHNYGTCITM